MKKTVLILATVFITGMASPFAAMACENTGCSKECACTKEKCNCEKENCTCNKKT